MNHLWTNHSASNLPTANDQPRISTNPSVPRFSQHKGNPSPFSSETAWCSLMGLFVRLADELLLKESKKKRYDTMVVGNT